jgi:hypothetical protein
VNNGGRRGGGRRLAIGLLAGLAVAGLGLATARPAEARLIDLHAGVLAGGMTGWGSDSRTPDFFNKTRGGAFGAEVGVKLLVFDLSVRFLQVADTGGLTGTLAQAMLGFEIDVPVGEARTEDGKRKLILRPGVAGGVGFGTPGPVQTPYNAAQISDKGVLTQFKLALEYNIYPLLGIGVEADAGYHYFLGGAATAVNDTQDHSSGEQIAGFGTLTFHLGY